MKPVIAICRVDRPASADPNFFTEIGDDEQISEYLRKCLDSMAIQPSKVLTLTFSNFERPTDVTESIYLEWGYTSLRYLKINGCKLSTVFLANTDKIIDIVVSASKLRILHLEKVNASGLLISSSEVRELQVRDSKIGKLTANMDAKIISADYSGSILPNHPVDWMNTRFRRTEKGYIVYKVFGAFQHFPDRWLPLIPGRVIEEEVNYDRHLECACGINFATLQWLVNNCWDSTAPEKYIFEMLIEYNDLATLCVPYVTNGKARCGRATILRMLTPREACKEAGISYSPSPEGLESPDIYNPNKEEEEDDPSTVRESEDEEGA